MGSTDNQNNQKTEHIPTQINIIRDPNKQQHNKKQKAQLMLTNLRDAFIGQSRSPNISHMLALLGIVSYCA